MSFVGLRHRGMRRVAAAVVATAAIGLCITPAASAEVTPSLPGPTTSPGETIDGLPVESFAWLVVTKKKEKPLRGAITKKSRRAKIERLQIQLGWAGYEWLWVTGVMDGGTALALQMLQGKYLLPVTGKADAKTVKKLVSVAGDGKLDPRCLGDGVTLCVSKDQRVTRYVKNGRVLKTLNTNFGPEKGHPKYGMYSATREGVFRTFDRQESTVSTLYGYVMPFWMGFDGGIGFHYSAYFDETGYIDTSMGCTTIADYAGMKWLYDNSPLGTKVVVY